MPVRTPCSEDDIREAERVFGQPLPTDLREMYFAFDGFEHLHTAFLWPLLRRRGIVWNHYQLRDEAASQGDPAYQAFVSQCLFFGYDGCFGYWGYKRDLPGKIIRWGDEEGGTAFTIVGDTPLDAWRAEKQACDAAGAEEAEPGSGAEPAS